MSEPDAGDRSASAPREAEVHGRKGISIVWLIPLVAAVVAGGLAYRSYMERGPTITITFDTATGLEAGKTTIRYRDVVVGTVTDIEVAEDLSHVVVTAQMVASAKSRLVEGTRFWVVSPHVSAAGISGLSTLISGVYIAIEPGPAGGKPPRIFKGLSEQPLDLGDKKGLRLVLRSSRLGGISDGSSIYYRGTSVGEVVRHRLTDDGKGVVIDAFIRDPYDKYVVENTVFWNASGFHVSAGLGGVHVDVESAAALIGGGVAFDAVGAPQKAASDGAEYTLFASRAAAVESRADRDRFRLVLETSDLGSLKAGDPVLYREVDVGQVVSYRLNQDGQSVGVLIEIDPPYDRLVRTNTAFWNASGISAGLGLHGLHVQTESLAALLEGGIAFSTPDQPGDRVKAGSVFELHAKADDAWQKWSPEVWLGPGSAPSTGASSDASKATSPPVAYHYKGAAAGKSDSHHWFSDLFHHGKSPQSEDETEP